MGRASHVFCLAENAFTHGDLLYNVTHYTYSTNHTHMRSRRGSESSRATPGMQTKEILDPPPPRLKCHMKQLLI